jgi:hypothetical protein
MTTALLVGGGLLAYALYRQSEHGGHVVHGEYVGAGNIVDYKNPADARSDKRPWAKLTLMQPYQIFNPGGGGRPYEVDAQGAPTGRELILPGETATPGGIIVGAGKVVDYLNPNDARSEKRAWAKLTLMQPYQILNPGGGFRPYEIDAQGAPTGRQLVLPNESPTVGNPAEYVMVGAKMSAHPGQAAWRTDAAWHGSSAVRGQWDYIDVGGEPTSGGEEFTGAWPYYGSSYGYGGGGGLFGGVRRRMLERQLRLQQLRQQLLMQQLQQQQMLAAQQQLADQQAAADLSAQTQTDDTGV